MKKRHIVYIVIVAASIGFIASSLFGGHVSAWVSNIGFIRRFNILRPQAPIVINTREEVRVNDSEDVVASANKAKSRVASVLFFDGQHTTLTGSAVALSQDGVFATVVDAVPAFDAKHVYIKLGPTGSVIPVESLVRDPATNIVLIKVNSRDVQPISFARSLEVQPGTRVVLVSGMPDQENFYFLASFVASRETVSGYISTDRPGRSFGLQSTPGLVPGQAIVNLNGELLGIWDGLSIVPADVLQDISASYFANSGTVQRPMFGITYRFVSPNDAQLARLPVGARISIPNRDATAIVSASPAEKAGLKIGDIITQVNDKKISDSTTLELELSRAKPGDTVVLTINRGQDTLTLQLVAGELK